MEQDPPSPRSHAQPADESPGEDAGHREALEPRQDEAVPLPGGWTSNEVSIADTVESVPDVQPVLQFRPADHAFLPSRDTNLVENPASTASYPPFEDLAVDEALIRLDYPTFEPQPAVVAPDPAKPDSLVYGALLRFNTATDRLLRLLGPLGWSLRTAAGRHLLGWFGMVLLVGAVALFLGSWLGWTR
jgi:hypothetical protein